MRSNDRAASSTALCVSDFISDLFDMRSSNASSENESIADVITAALCPRGSADVSSCLALRSDQRSAVAYVRVISVYVTMHLAAYAFYRAVTVPGNDLVVTRSQRLLALGHPRYSSGILEHYVDEASASNSSQMIAVFNCYDAILAVSNGHWRCK